MKLSALVLAKNEEEVIEDCLKQLAFADEIIVLDQNSNDNTAKIASKYTDKIIKSNFEHFSRNLNSNGNRTFTHGAFLCCTSQNNSHRISICASYYFACAPRTATMCECPKY